VAQTPAHARGTRDEYEYENVGGGGGGGGGGGSIISTEHTMILNISIITYTPPKKERGGRAP
jgi:hypothetical protein